jgi:hypothetical protein
VPVSGWNGNSIRNPSDNISGSKNENSTIKMVASVEEQCFEL